MATTTLEDFTQITLVVIEENGISAYIPTLMFDQQVHAIEGIPDDIDHRDAIQTVIRRSDLQGREFFFGVRSGAREITTGHYTPDGCRFMSIVATDQGYVVAPLPSCAWWTVGC